MPTRRLSIRYEDELRLWPSRWHHAGAGLLCAVALAYPLLLGGRWLTLANLTLVAVVGSVGLMILTGFAGQISLGHAAFLAAGAYTAAISSFTFGAPFWLGMVAGTLVAAVLGLVVGPFAFRLRGLYLAIVTLGLVFVVQHVLLTYSSVTGGATGIRAPMHWWFAEPGARSTFGIRVELGPVELGGSQQLYYLYLAIAALVTWFAANLRRSRTGRAMAAVRDRDIAAAVVGVPLRRIKLVAFGLSSGFAGLAGAMLAFQQQLITVDPPFNLLLSIQYVAMIVLGGLGTVAGAVLGALAYTMLGPVAEALAQGVPVMQRLTSPQQQVFLLSVLVIGFLAVEPLGLYGLWLRLRRYLSLWPFKQ